MTRAFGTLFLLLFAAVPNVGSAFAACTGVTTVAVPQTPWGVAPGDFNGDGKVDLAVTAGTGVSILVGDGTGGYVATSSYPTGQYDSSIVVADFNGDGKLDLAVSNVASNRLSILLGNGNGTFTVAGTYQVNNASGITLGDVNGDSKLDVVVASPPLEIAVLLGNGNGTFAAAVSYPTGAYPAGAAPTTVALADFNRDGKLDAATSNYADASISVLSGNGNGTFGPPTEYASGPGTIGVVAGDFNADGRPDIAATNRFADDVSVFINSGAGTFGAPVSYAVANNPNALTSADVNGDGKLDLLVASGEYGDGAVSVLLGTGTGTFTSAGTTFAGLTFISLSVTDFNNDGKQDVAAVDVNGPRLVLLPGLGNGAFCAADISITKTAAPPYFATLPLTYTIAVSNTGTGPATNVLVKDTLPAGSSLTSATPSQGTCAGNSPLTCSLGALAAGGSATITVVTKAPAAPGQVSNTATVSADGGDRSLTDNSATAAVTTAAPPPLPAVGWPGLVALGAALATIGLSRARWS